MIYKCLSCGAALMYNPEENGMQCAYCDRIFLLSELDGVTEKDEVRTQWVDSANELEELDESQVDQLKVNVYTCTACGAELMVNRNEASTFCAYCGQPTVVFNRVSSELKPDYCIPFLITGEEAVRLIRQKLKKGLFIPKEILDLKVDMLRGIYIPFWLHDVKIREKANISARRSRGKHSYAVHFYRDAEAVYNKITADGSKKLNDELSQRLEPYNMEGLRPFEPEYLSGFYADRYDVSELDSRGVVYARAVKFIEDDIKDSCENCHGKSITSKGTKVDFLKCQYVLLPAWFLTFWYNGELYTILVNGQTGKVVGNLPISKKKVAFNFAVLATTFSLIFASIGHAIESELFYLTNNTVDLMKLLFGVVAVIGIISFMGIRKYLRFEADRKHFKSTNTVSYVKERQGNEWES